MDWRGVVADGVRAHGLSDAQRLELLALAGLDREPAPLLARLPLLLAGLAGLLCGLGLIFAIAANWSGLPRTVQFALLQAAVGLGALVYLLVSARLRPGREASVYRPGGEPTDPQTAAAPEPAEEAEVEAAAQVQAVPEAESAPGPEPGPVD